MTGTVLFSRHGFEVSRQHLRTPRKTFALRNIEAVAVERPLILFAIPPAIGLSGFAAIFHRYLYAGEIVTVLAASAAAIASAILVGTLRVHSLALRDTEIVSCIGLVTTLRQVRAAVEEAMAVRDHDHRGDA